MEAVNLAVGLAVIMKLLDEGRQVVRACVRCVAPWPRPATRGVKPCVAKTCHQLRVTAVPGYTAVSILLIAVYTRPRHPRQRLQPEALHTRKTHQLLLRLPWAVRT